MPCQTTVPYRDPPAALRDDNIQPIFEKLIDEPALCEWLNISPATAQRYRYVGGGPKYVVLSARRIAYRPSAVREWLESREVESGSVQEANAAIEAAE